MPAPCPALLGSADWTVSLPNRQMLVGLIIELVADWLQKFSDQQRVIDQPLGQQAWPALLLSSGWSSLVSILLVCSVSAAT